MTITQSDFLKVLSEQGQYQIPIYQRAYAWENEQCEKLIRDIAEAGTPGNPNHFIGSVILKKEKSSILSLYNVIDGQQRLTSVSLLLLALRRYCLDFPATLQDQLVSCAIKGLFETHLVNQTFKNTSLYYKLQLKAGNDRTEYENLLRNILGNGRLAKNFQFFYDFIKDNKISPQEIYDGIRNAQLALVVLANDENPQLLFEAVNDTGVDLTQVDLIRNWIFMGLSSEDQDKLYNKYWRPMEIQLGSNFDSLLYYFTEANCLDRLGSSYYSEFKHHFLSYSSNSSSIELLLQDIQNFSTLYMNYLNANFGDKDKISKQLYELRKTGQNVFVPVILKVLSCHKKGINDNEILSILHKLESYIVRRAILDLSTRSLGNVMVRLLNNCRNLNEFTNCMSSLTYAQRNPDDLELKNKLKNLNFYELHNSYYYLWRIEKHLNPAFSLEDPTIEHILPQEMHTTANPKKGVSNQDDYNWEKDLNSEADYTWRTYLNVLGNLTILPRSENSKMGDLRFKKKQDYLSKSSDGLNYGYNYTSIRISQGLKNYSVWNEKSILDRSDKMVDYICEIWPH